MSQPIGKSLLSISLGLTAVFGGRARPADDLGIIASRVFEEFRCLKASGFQRMLERIRQPPPSPSERDLVRRQLPKEGELRPSAGEAKKLAALDEVLRYHGREADIEVKLVEAVHAAVGLHARSYILISRAALRQLDAAEVEALAAHELGHDYYWDEYRRAVDMDHKEELQELELKCDAISVFTLRELGVSPQKLATAVERLAEFNSRFGTALNAARYIPQVERIRFINALANEVQGPRRGQHRRE